MHRHHRLGRQPGGKIRRLRAIHRNLTQRTAAARRAEMRNEQIQRRPPGERGARRFGTATAAAGGGESLALYLVYQDRRHLPQRVRVFMDFLTGELPA